MSDFVRQELAVPPAYLERLHQMMLAWASLGGPYCSAATFFQHPSTVAEEEICSFLKPWDWQPWREQAASSDEASASSVS